MLKTWLPHDVLPVTLMANLAVAAIMATMLVRFSWFRRILLTEKRDWPSRRDFALGLGVPLVAGVIARLVLGYDAADLSLPGAYLAGLIAGPYAGAIVGLAVGLPASVAGEFIALPLAIGSGFAGGGRRAAGNGDTSHAAQPAAQPVASSP